MSKVKAPQVKANAKPVPTVNGAATKTMKPGAGSHRGVAQDPRAKPGLIAQTIPKHTPYGNEKAKDVGKGGPGTGRTNHGPSGKQAQHGESNPGQPREASGRPLKGFGL